MKIYVQAASLTALVTPVLIVLSCSHLSNLDHKNGGLSQQALILSFQKAKEMEKKDPATSCSLFKGISKENSPLKSLALIKSHLICADPQNLEKIPDQLMQQEPWLTSLELDRQIFEAQRDM